MWAKLAPYQSDLVDIQFHRLKAKLLMLRR
jgi:hypothetical protein